MKKRVLSLLIVLVLCLPGCNGGGTTAESTPPQVTPVEATAEPTPDPTPEPTPTPSPEEELLAIGDAATLGDWSITVSDFYFTDHIQNGDYFYYKPDEGNLYAVVSAQITNNGKESGTFLPMFSTNSDVRADIYYAGEYEYSATTLMVDEDLHNSTLNPLTSKSGIIAFSLPEMIESSEEALDLTFSSGWDKVTFALR